MSIISQEGFKGLNIAENIAQIPVAERQGRLNLVKTTDKFLRESDIVDNLTSEQVSKPLSAKQGKILRDLITSKEIGKAYDTIEDMIDDLNSQSQTGYGTGFNLFIFNTDDPDFWIGEVKETFVPYVYTTDEAFLDLIRQGPVQIGYYRIGISESKIDITNLVSKDDIANNLTTTTAGEVLDARQGKVLDDKISGKVDKIEGKGLSTNDYTNIDKDKVDTIKTDGDGTKYYNDAGEYSFVKRIQDEDNSSYFEAGGEVSNTIQEGSQGNGTSSTIQQSNKEIKLQTSTTSMQTVGSHNLLINKSLGIYRASVTTATAGYGGTYRTTRTLDLLGLDDGMEIVYDYTVPFGQSGAYQRKYVFGDSDNPTNPNNVARLKDLQMTEYEYFGPPPVPANFEDATPADIELASQYALIPSTWVIGDTREITLTDNSVVTLRIADKQIGRYDKVGGGKTNIVLEFRDCFPTLAMMNQTRTSAGGWDASYMRSTIIPVLIYNLLPQEWKDVIPTVMIPAANGGNQAGTVVVYSQDKMFLPSEVEIQGTNVNSHFGEGSIFDYYNGISDTDKIKTVTGTVQHWFLRSAHANNDKIFCVVRNNGTPFYGFADSAHGVSPCFAI